MEFRILGPLEASDEGRPLDVGGAKQRALLAVLLLNANRVVSRDRLIDALWEEKPPETAAKALQVHVSQLRKVLGAGRITTRAPGYSIQLEPGELDLDRFQSLVEEGGAAKVRAALSLWRGPPLAEFALQAFAQAEIGRLEELRLVVLEQLIDADLALGRQAELVGELEILVAEHPLRERLRGQLMLALYRSGRQAEAVAAYQDARRALVDELGIEPGRALQDLERAILNQDRTLEPAPRAEPAAELRSEPEPPEVPLIPEERKVVTVLFADLVGFTRRSENLDPEDVRSILGRWYARVRPVLEQHGGSVEKYIGDAVMALFGAPVAHGDDPERAVRAALAVREAVHELNQADPELGLEFRIGINTGEVVISVLEGTTFAAGDVVNTAARLQSAAPVNGILVGEEAYRATRTSIRYEQVEPVVAKGKELPVRAWAALEALSTQPERPLNLVAIVGRDAELGLLRGVWERVVGERRPHLVTVFAPPGIGKSRLATEFLRLVEGEAVRIVRGRAVPYGQTAGLGPFAQQVKKLARIFEGDPIPLAREKLEQTVAALAGTAQMEDVASLLAVLIGLEPTREGEKDVAFYGARRLVEVLAAERPAVLVFEDIHWADQPDLDLVEYLAARLRDVPVLLLAMARPDLLELRPRWGGGLPTYTGISLEPLSTDESRELATSLLAQRAASLGEEVAAQLVDLAEGNPLFIEELVAVVAEQPAAEVGELPTNVRGIIAARIDAIPSAERSILLDASVLGKAFWRGALEHLAAEGPLSEVLDSLEQRDIIRRQPASRIQGDQEFHFKHMLIRDVAYSTLPRKARRVRHAAAAAFIEQAAGERAGEWAPILAHHWREAGEPDRELRYVLLAAERAWPGEGVILYDRALELIPEGEPDRQRGVRLQRALTLQQASQFERAIDELDALLPELEGRERFEAIRSRARAAFWVGDVDGARAYAEQAKALAEELGDEQLQAVTLAFFGSLGSLEGKLTEAIELNERAVAIWKPGSHRRELADTLGWLSLQNYWLGRYEPALEHALRAQALGRETSSEEIVFGVSDIGLALAGLGRHEEALAEFAEGAALGRELELAPRWTARLMNMWAGTLRELGDFEGARLLNEEAIELASSAAFPAAVASGKIDLLFADLATGEVGRATAAWPELWETAEATTGWHSWLWLIRLSHARAEIEFAHGKLEEAAEAAVQAVERAESVGRVKYALASRLVLGSALLPLKRHEEAIDAVRRAVVEAQGLKHPPSTIHTGGRLAEILAATGDDAGAEAALIRAKQAIESFVASLSEERRASFLQTAPVRAVLAIAR